MNDIHSFGLIIVILMILMAYLKQIIPQGKTKQFMNAVVSIFILLSLVNGIKNFDISSVKALLDQDYTQSDEVWHNAAKLISAELKTEFKRFLTREKIDAEVIEVYVEGSAERFEIKKVVLSSKDKETAKKILAGRYQIELSYIEVKNE